MFFYDAGIAWNSGQSISLGHPDTDDQTTQRYLLRSYGFGLRLNLFNLAVLRWDSLRAARLQQSKGLLVVHAGAPSY